MVKKKPAKAKKPVKKTKVAKKPAKKPVKKVAAKADKKVIVVAPVVDSSGVVMITPVEDDVVHS